MPDPVSRPTRRAHVAGRAVLLLAAIGLLAGPAVPIVAAASVADNLITVTTPFPAIVAEPGSTASFKLAFATGHTGQVKLVASGAPSDWTTRFRGGGSTIDGVFVAPGALPDVTFDVEIPDGTPAGTSMITVKAIGDWGASSFLPLTIRVADAAAGDVTLTSDFPELKGPSSSSFNFNLTLKNGTATEATFAIDATGPDGWIVTAKPAGQAQATSITVSAGSTGSISVSVTAPADVEAGSVPVDVTVDGAGKTAKTELKVTITGTYTLDVSTSNGVLSTTANAGSTTDLTVVISNSGTAPVTAITPSAAAPTGWKVEFEPATIDTIAAGATANVVAHITPTSDAITGDYKVTMTAKAAEASGDVVIRVTVDTPAFWWIAGVVLIVAVFAGLYWVFRTYGRR